MERLPPPVAPFRRPPGPPARCVAAGLLLLLGFCQVAAARTVAYANGRWFDGERFTTGTRYAVDGRLVAAPPASVDARVDLAQRWVVPPFAEAHNHNLQNAANLGRFRDLYLREGVFYAAMLCGNEADNKGVRDALRGPGDLRLVQTVCVSSPDGHPLGMVMADLRRSGSDAGPETVRDRFYVSLETREDIDAKWPLIRAARPDWIKAILVHSEDPARRADPKTFGYNGLAPELLAPLVARAHADGLRVAVHTDSAADFETAVRAGADIIAHLPGYAIRPGKQAGDYRLGDAALAEAAQRGTVVIATASIAAFIAGKDADALRKIQVVQKDNLRRLRAAGVPIAMGSDRFTGTSLAEYDYLAGFGLFTPAELLRMLSMDTPKLLFPNERIGCLEDGCRADFLVLDADPLVDGQAVHRIVRRVMGGAELPPPASP